MEGEGLRPQSPMTTISEVKTMAANSDFITGFSIYYFVGTDGQYDGAIMDTSGNGVDEEDCELDIPQRPLQTIIVDDGSIEADEDTNQMVWATSNGHRICLFFKTEDEDEFETIRNGYREVMTSGGGYATFEGDSLYCQASDIHDEI